jgi:RNA polymerase sigma factor (sigma-70 family)
MIELINLCFSEIFEKHYRRVYYTALSIVKDHGLAEDVLQETFLKAYDRLEEVQGEEKLGSWLSTIAARKAIDQLRKQKRVTLFKTEDVLMNQIDHDCNVEEDCQMILFEETMKRKIHMLSPKLRVVMKLHYYDQLKESEIAQKLKLSPGAVKSRLHRGRMAMRMKLSDELIRNHPA